MRERVNTFLVFVLDTILITNFREVEDGVGSQTIFNGDEQMTDQLYTRSNNFISGTYFIY